MDKTDAIQSSLSQLSLTRRVQIYMGTLDWSLRSYDHWDLTFLVHGNNMNMKRSTLFYSEAHGPKQHKILKD